MPRLLQEGTFFPFALTPLPLTNMNLSSADYDYCSKKVIGYKPVDVMEAIDGTDFNTAGRKTANALTGAFILHPIACGLTFIAAIVAVGGIVGSLVGTILGVLAWILTVVVMAIDFAIFGVSYSGCGKCFDGIILIRFAGHQKSHQ